MADIRDGHLHRAEARTIDEWVKVYKEKTGEDVDIPEGFRVLYIPKRGFALMKPIVNEKTSTLYIYHLCGDAEFWHDHAEVLCSQTGIKTISTVCTRKILAYIRFWGWKIIKEFQNDSYKRYICEDEQGRLVICTPTSINEYTGRADYTITQYLNIKAGDYEKCLE